MRDIFMAMSTTGKALAGTHQLLETRRDNNTTKLKDLQIDLVLGVPAFLYNRAFFSPLLPRAVHYSLPHNFNDPSPFDARQELLLAKISLAPLGVIQGLSQRLRIRCER